MFVVLLTKNLYLFIYTHNEDGTFQNFRKHLSLGRFTSICSRWFLSRYLTYVNLLQIAIDIHVIVEKRICVA